MKWSPGGGPPPRSCRRCFPVDQKRSRGKRNARDGGESGEERTRIMNTYACTHRGGTSFTASGSGKSACEGGHAASARRAAVAAAAAPPLPEQMFPPLRRSLSVLLLSVLLLPLPARLLSSPPTDVLGQIWLYLRVACRCAAPGFGVPGSRMKYLTFLLQQVQSYSVKFGSNFGLNRRYINRVHYCIGILDIYLHYLHLANCFLCDNLICDNDTLYGNISVCVYVSTIAYLIINNVFAFVLACLFYLHSCFCFSF